MKADLPCWMPSLHIWSRNGWKFLADKENRQPWHNIIRILPTSYNRMRTVTMNYENPTNIYYARRNHKLAEWHTLCDWIDSPYASELIANRSEG